jgi:hypothetical protein
MSPDIDLSGDGAVIKSITSLRNDTDTENDFGTKNKFNIAKSSVNENAITTNTVNLSSIGNMLEGPTDTAIGQNIEKFPILKKESPMLNATIKNIVDMSKNGTMDIAEYQK